MKTLLKKIILEAKADAFNAGYNSILFRVIFCKEANEWVIQKRIDKNKWLCLH